MGGFYTPLNPCMSCLCINDCPKTHMQKTRVKKGCLLTEEERIPVLEEYWNRVEAERYDNEN